MPASKKLVLASLLIEILTDYLSVIARALSFSYDPTAGALDLFGFQSAGASVFGLYILAVRYFCLIRLMSTAL